MKFVTFSESGRARAGVLIGDGAGPMDHVVDLAHPAMHPALDGIEPQMQSLLDAGLPGIIQAIEAHGLIGKAELPLASVDLLAPLPRPRRIFGIAHNYRDALAERGMPPPREPVLFMKAPGTIIGPGEAIVLPAGIGGVTYEAELAAVIGTHAERVSRDQALGHVAAYGCFNDISASDVIKADGRFDRGKNFTTFGPFGPFLVSSDDVADPLALQVTLQVDSRELQHGSTSNMMFGVADLVSWLSHRQPLAPGDIIATGTPAGVAALHKPPAWLKPGSIVDMQVEGLGRLVNPIIEGPAPHG